MGEQVVIRYGRQQGLKATILKALPADAYKVRVEDGSVHFYSGKGLATERTSAAKIAP